MYLASPCPCKLHMKSLTVHSAWTIITSHRISWDVITNAMGRCGTIFLYRIWKIALDGTTCSYTGTKLNSLTDTINKGIIKIDVQAKQITKIHRNTQVFNGICINFTTRNFLRLNVFILSPRFYTFVKPAQLIIFVWLILNRMFQNTQWWNMLVSSSKTERKNKKYHEK